MNYFRTTIGAFVSICLLTGCAKEKEPQSISKPSETTEYEQDTAATASFMSPLSGQPLVEESSERAVAVTMNNHPKARPQSGLAEADIVLEMLAEGEVTRLLAIYQSEHPTMIGPIRSSRDYFIDLANGYNAFYVSHGYSPDAKTKLEAGEIDHINGMQYDGHLFERSSDRKAPHNSYISWENVQKGAELVQATMNTPPTPSTFTKDIAVVNQIDSVAKEIIVSYYNDASFTSSYLFDEETNVYHRFVQGVQTINENNKRPVELSNIIVIEAPHTIVDNVGRRAIDFQNGGQATLFQQGTSTETNWVRKDGRLVVMKDNQEVDLIPGKTWIHIVPELSFVSTQ